MKKIIALAVMLMMLVMVFSLAGCSRKLREVETSDMIELQTWVFTSGVPNNLILVKYHDENAAFELTVDKGNFWIKNNYEKNAIIKPNDRIRWQNWEENKELNVKQAYVDIILKIDNHIIGYAVVKITNPSDDNSNHTATLLKSALFPKVRNKYQKVTEKEVKELIELIKNK